MNPGYAACVATFVFRLKAPRPNFALDMTDEEREIMARHAAHCQQLARAVGARDLALGLGGLQALTRNDGSAPPWLAAAAVCDAVDFGATWTAGRGIPRQARSGVLGIAGVFSLLSAIAAVGNGRS